MTTSSIEESLRLKVADVSLLWGSFLSFAIWLVKFFYGAYFHPMSIVKLTTIFLLFATYIFRNRLSLKVKTSLIVLSLLMFVYADLWYYGERSTNSVLLIIAVYMSVLAYNFRKTLILYFIAIFIYLSIGYYQLVTEGENFTFLIVDVLVLTASLFPIAYYHYSYGKAVHELIDRLKQQEIDLERIVDQRTLELEENSQVANQLYEDLKQTQSQMIQSEKMSSLGVLVAGVGHEINNPLNFIQSGAHQTRVVAGKTDAKTLTAIEPYLKIIEEGAGRITRIVKSLKYFANQQELSFNTCNIHDIIEDCLEILQYKVRGGVDVQKKYRCDGRVVGNNGRLHQAILNVLLNAMQAIEQIGKITIETSITPNQMLKIVIADSGEGIKKDDLDKVADPFFTTKLPGEGIGLGLFVTNKIIKEHKGSWKVKSKHGKGTTFTIELPVDQ